MDCRILGGGSWDTRSESLDEHQRTGTENYETETCSTRKWGIRGCKDGNNVIVWGGLGNSGVSLW